MLLEGSPTPPRSRPAALLLLLLLLHALRPAARGARLRRAAPDTDTESEAERESSVIKYVSSSLGVRCRACGGGDARITRGGPGRVGKKGMKKNAASEAEAAERAAEKEVDKAQHALQQAKDDALLMEDPENPSGGAAVAVQDAENMLVRAQAEVAETQIQEVAAGVPPEMITGGERGGNAASDKQGSHEPPCAICHKRWKWWRSQYASAPSIWWRPEISF